MRRQITAAVLLCLTLGWPGTPLLAWDAEGHRVITCLALDAVSLSDVPWLATPAVRRRILFQANEPDRRRAWPSPVLRHINAPDHYLNLDGLQKFGLRPATLPRLRRDYLRSLVLANVPRRLEAGAEANRNSAGTLSRPGFLAHAMAEAYARLQAALHQARILDGCRHGPHNEQQLEQAHANVIYELGRLSHLVGDGSQPLHTTRHFNGWWGPNPGGYTTNRAFHHKVDSRPGDHAALTCAALAGSLAPLPHPDPQDPWPDILAYLELTFSQVEPLYRLEQAHDMDGEKGTRFTAARLRAGAGMLAGLLRAALISTRPTAVEMRRVEACGRAGALDLGIAATPP
ncbi:MAG: hypothetical protein O7A07_08410 [Acidobacteria bacterium]|nr:hypothetical protein [Acidobacteriota bacterium]